MFFQSEDVEIAPDRLRPRPFCEGGIEPGEPTDPTDPLSYLNVSLLEALYGQNLDKEAILL